jgi:hypothetical protein
MGYYRQYYRISESNLSNIKNKISPGDHEKLGTIIGREFADSGSFLRSAAPENESVVLKKALTRVPLRSFSFVCDNSGIKILAHVYLIDAVLNPPDPPFVICIGESGKKHLAFKAKINNSVDSFFVATDGGLVSINRKNLFEIYPIIQAWYTTVPGKEYTWFTKNETLEGSENFRRIEDYGVQKYYRENKIIKEFRGSGFLWLVVYCLKRASFD